MRSAVNLPIVILLLLTFGGIPTEARIRHVPNEYETIQSAIDAAHNGDTVLVQPETYVENISIIGKDIVVASLFLTTNDDNFVTRTIIDGDEIGSVVNFRSDVSPNCKLVGFTLQNGLTNYGGGIYLNSSSPILDHLVIWDNYARRYGGGVYATHNSDPTMINVTISGNTADLGNGAFHRFDGSDATILNSILYGNTPFGMPDALTVTYSDIEHGYGGEGNIEDDPDWVDPENGDLSLNEGSPCIDTGDPNSPEDRDGSRADMGALFYNQGNVRVFVVPDEFETIQAAIDSCADGDTVLVHPGQYVENIDFLGKEIVVGSLFLLTNDRDYIHETIIDGDGNGSVVTFDNSETENSILTGFTILNGDAQNGGGIIISRSNPVIYAVEIEANTAVRGGGIYLLESDALLRNVAVIQNASSFDGSGISCYNANPELINCTLSQNITNNDGGGFYCDEDAGPILNSCIVRDNDPAEIDDNGEIGITYSDIEGGWEGEGNIDADPLFADPDGGDFQLTWENWREEDETKSPCIDTGDPNLPQDPEATRADMGAYYWHQEPYRAIIVIDPQALDTQIDTGDMDTLNFDISNDGDTLLIFQTEVNITQEPEFAPRRDRRGGPDEIEYEWRDNDEEDGPDYNWINVSNREGVIDLEFGNDTNEGPFDLGFDFEFYGNSYNSVNMCSNGWASFTSTRTYYSYANWEELPSNRAPENFLGVAMSDWNPAAGGGNYYFWSDEEVAVMSWVDIPHISGQGSWTFQIVLTPDGMIKYQYAETGSPDGVQLVGLQNEDKDYGFEILRDEEDYLVAGRAIGISRVWPLWIRVEPVEDEVAAEGNLEMDVIIDAYGLIEGNYAADVHILSNDPENPDMVVTVSVLVIGIPSIELVWDDQIGYPDIVDWNQAYENVLVGYDYDIVLDVINDGTATLQIDSVAFDNETFSVEDDSISVPPMQTGELTVTFHAEERGQHDATMTVYSNDPDQGEYEVSLTATAVILAPAIVVEWSEDAGYPDVVDWNLVYAEVYATAAYDIPINIRNDGDRDLEVIGTTSEHDYFSANPDAFVLGPDEEREVTLTFEADTSGEFTSTITIHNNTEDNPNYPVPVHADALDPPVLVLDPESITDSLWVGWTTHHVVNMANEGEATLNFTIDHEIISEPERDNGIRDARILRGINGPRRDDAGDLIDSFDDPVGGGANYKGLIWDIENQWMWICHYISPYQVWPVDPNDNYDRVDGEGFNSQTGCLSGCMVDGVLYLLSPQGPWYVVMYSRDGDNLGRVNINFQAGGVAYSEELDLLFVMNGQSNLDIHVFELDEDGDVGDQVGIINDYRNLIDNWWSRSMCWVDRHREGQLWLNTQRDGGQSQGNTVHQLNINTDEWEAVEKVQEFDTWDSGTGMMYDGIAHDRENLWACQYSTPEIRIFDDGMNEWGWLGYQPMEGSIPGGENLDINVTLDARGESEGFYEADMIFHSNDPLDPDMALNVRVFISIPPSLVVEWDDDYGFPDEVNWNLAYLDLYNNSPYDIELTFFNYAEDPTNVDSIRFEGEDGEFFTADHDEFSIDPEDEITVTVTLDADESGVHNPTMIIYSDARRLEEYPVQLIAETFIPPAIEVDTDTVEDSLITGEFAYHNVNIANTGEAVLRFTIDPVSVSEPERDDRIRTLRSIRGPERPHRDDLGDVVDRFSYNRIGSNAYKGGIAWDWENRWMWLTSFTVRGIGAVDPNNDFHEEAWTNLDYGPMGAGWHDGVLYVVPWANQQLRMYDDDLNLLGNLNTPTRPTAVDCADDFIIYITDVGGRNIEIIDYDGERIATIQQGDWLGYVGNQSSRSLCWVDEHPDGQLWINTARHIWQLAVDTDEWEVTECVSDFNWQQGATEWDGVGHDGTNLWLGSMGQAEYYIVDDGVTEQFWLRVDITEGELDGDSNIDVTVILNASWLQGGDYEGALIIDSNDPENPETTVAVYMYVDAAPDIEVLWEEDYGYPDEIDWNLAYEDIYPDLEYEITVEVNSSGVTDLEVDSIRINDEAFTANADEFDLDPGESGDVMLTFETDEAGEHNATLTFYSNSEANPELQIPLHVLVENPPVIRITPRPIEITLRSGEIAERTLTVENRGEALLRFDADIDITQEPERDIDIRTIRQIGTAVAPRRDDAGEVLYSVQSPFGANQFKNLGYDADNNWMWHYQYMNPRRTIAYDLDNDNEIVADWNLGALNPMDIAVHDGKIYIMSLWGAYVSRYDLEGNNLNNLNLNLGGANANGVAVDTDEELLLVGANNYSNIYIFDLDGNSIGDFSGVRQRVGNQNWHAIEWVPKHRDGHLWVHTAGRVWQFAVDTDNWEFIGDEAVQDFQVHSTIEWDGIAHDGHNLWVSDYGSDDINVYDDGITELYWLMLDPTEGEVQGGNSMDLTLSFIATDLIVGEYLANVIFSSNDPINQDVRVGVTMNIEPAPDIEITWEFSGEDEPDLVDWNRYHNEMYFGIEYRVPLTVHNLGGASLTVEDIVSDSDEFSAEPTQFEIDPYDTREIEFMFTGPDPGEFEGIMTITSNDPDEEQDTLRLHASASAMPQIEVDPDAISDTLQADTENDYTINIANTGLAELRWWSSLEVIDGPERDDGNYRLARHINSPSIPSRDDLGEEIDRFTWQRSGIENHKAGIAWDSENEWMWLTSYNNDYIGAVDPASNFEEVTAWQPDGQHPMGAAWLDGIIYVVNWARQWLGRWDAEGNNLGQFDTQIRPTALSSTNEYLLVMSDAGERNIIILTPDGEEIGTIDNYQQFITGNSRSLQWVDLHPDGQLWINTPGHIYQIEVNGDWEAVDLASDFEWGGEEEWDGIGHDGYNLYLGAWNYEHYYIVDDGIEEIRWIYLIPARGIVEMDSDQDAVLTLDLHDFELGEYEVDLHIYSNDPIHPYADVNVGFSVLEVDIAVEPMLLDFGEVDFLTTDTLEVTVRNEGWFELTVSDISVDSDYFSVEFDDPIILGPDAESMVSVVFSPEEEADYEAFLFVTSDDPDEPTVEVRLIGTGIYVPYPPEVVSPIEDFEIDEDFEPFEVADLDTVFFDPNGEDLSYSAFSDNEDFTVEIVDESLLRIDSAQDWNGDAEVTVIADDNTGDWRDERSSRTLRSVNSPDPRRDLTTEHTFTVTVLAVNDPPVVAIEIPDQEVDEDTGPWIIADLDTLFYDVDGDELEYLVLSFDSLFTHLDEDNVLSLDAPENFFDVDLPVLIIASDSQEEAEDGFLVTILNVNDPPVVVQPIPDQEFTEDSGHWDIADLDDVFYDVDNEVLTYEADPEYPLITEIIDDHMLTLDAPEDFYGENLTVTVTAYDDEGAMAVARFRPDLRDNGSVRGLRSISSTSGFNSRAPRRDESADDDFSVTITAVNDPPEWIDVPDAVEGSEDSTVQFDVVGFDVDGDDLTIEYSSDDLPEAVQFVDNDDGSGSFSWETGFEDAGQYSALFTLSDAGVDVDTTISITILNVNRLPIWTQMPESFEIDETDLLEFTVSGEDPDGQDIEITYSSDDLPESVEFYFDGTRAGTFSWQTTYEDSGTHTATFTMSDSEDEVSADVEITVLNVNRPPVLTEIGNLEIDEAEEFNLQLEAFDPDGDNLTFEAENLPDGATLLDDMFSWTPTYDQAGVYEEIIFRVWDDSEPSLSDEETIVITVLNVNRPPVLAEIGDLEIDEDEELTLQLQADDPDGDNLTFEAENLPEGATLLDDLFSWTPTYDQAGVYEGVIFRVWDDSEPSLSDEETIIITVNNVNRPPVFVEIDDIEIEENEALSLQLEASDPDGNNIFFEGGNLPEGATLVDDMFNWTPTYDQAGVYERVVFWVYDDGEPILSDRESITITVLNVNRPPVLSEIGNLEIDEAEEFSLQLEASDPDGNNIILESENLPDGSTLVDDLFSWTPTYDQAGVYEGVVFRVWDDGEPNLSDEETITITVLNVNRPPVLSEIGDIEIDETEEFSLQLDASDPDGNNIIFEAENLPDGATLVDDRVSWTPTYDQAGVYEGVIFRAWDDGEPNLFDEESITITVLNVNRPPVLTEIGDLVIEEAEEFNLQLEANDPDDDNLTFEAENLPDGATLEDDLFSWTPTYDQAGVYEGIIFRVYDDSDPVLSDEETITITVLNVNRAPILSEIGDLVIDETEVFSLQLEAYDPDGNNINFEAENLPEGATLDGNLFSWTPTYDQAGVYEDVIFRVWDDGEPNLSEEESITITVLNVNRPPVLAEIGDLEIEEAVASSLRLEANDPDDDNLTFEAENLPDGATLEENLFSWTPTYDQAGVYEGIILRVWDDSEPSLSDEETITITVLNVNRPPVLTGIGDLEIDEAEEFSLQLTGNDPDGNNIVFEAENLPDGATFEDDLFSWTPTYDQAGVYEGIVFRVWDDGEPNLSDEETITITVFNVNRPPVLTEIGDLEIDEAEEFSLQLEASDPDGNNISFEAENLPEGATLVDDMFSWTPTYDQAGVYEGVIFRAWDDGEPNLFDEESITITVLNVNRPPVLTEIGDLEIEEAVASSLQLEANDPDGDNLTFEAENLPDGATLEDDLFSWTPTYDQSGVYEGIIFRVYDDSEPVLSDEETVTITVLNVNRPPVWTNVPDEIEITETDTLELQVQGEDPDDDDLTIDYSSDDIPEAAMFNDNGDGTATLEWQTDYEDSGDYTALFILSDGTTDVEAQVMISVGNLNRPPEVIHPIPDIDVNEDPDPRHVEIADLDTVFNDPDDDEMSFDFSGYTEEMNMDIDEDNILFISPDENYNHPNGVEITVVADDRPEGLRALGHQSARFEGTNDINGGPVRQLRSLSTASAVPTRSLSDDRSNRNPRRDETTEETFILTITAINDPPEWVEVPEPVEVNEEEIVEFSVSGSDIDSENLSIELSLDDLPEAAGFDDAGDGSGQFTWQTTYEDAGDYTATFTISDGELEVDTDVEITVLNVNRTPFWTDVPEAIEAAENTLVQFDVVGEDPDGDDIDIIYWSDDLPEAVQFEFDGENTGTFSWQTTYEDSGSYTAHFAISDEEFEVEAEVEITILNVNRAPEWIDIPELVEADETETVQFTVTGEDPDGDEVSIGYSTDDLPEAAQFTDNDDGSGDFTWETTFNDSGSYTALLTISDDDLTTEATVSIRIGNVNRAPFWVEVEDTVEIDENELIEMTVTAEDPDDDNLTIEFASDDLPEAAEFTDNGDGTGIFTWQTNYYDAGEYSAELTVTDGDLSDIADVVILVSDVNQAPEVIGEIEDMTIEEDPDPRQVDIVDLDEVFSDPDNDELIFEFIAPNELNMNIDDDNLLFFSPDDDFNLPDGQQIVVTADDQRAEGFLLQMNRTPSTGLKQTGRDAGPVRRLRGIDDPFMNGLSPRRDLAVEASFILTIEAVPDPPEWVNIPEEINATVTERIHITIEAIDVDGDALEYSAEVPEGAEFTDNGDGTGLFEWQTTMDDEGDYTASFEVTDSDFTLEAEVPIHLSGLRELTVDLSRGWNMISLNINPIEEFYAEGEDRGPDVWLMIEQMRIDENNHRVFTLNDEKGDFCSPGWNYNGIDFWNLQEGYLIKLTEDFEATWSGVPIPADADVPIESGWNLIAYYPDYDLPATRGSGYYVLSPILDHVIIAKNDSGQFMAPEWGYSDMDPWTPGKGYQIKVDEDVVLNYPEPYDWLGAPIKPQTGNRLEGHWSSTRSTGSNVSVLVTGITGYHFSHSDQIAAFSPSGELVGLGNTNNGQSCGLAVWGDDVSTEAIDGLVKGDKFELRLYNAESDEVYSLDIVTVRQGTDLVYETDGFAVVEMSLGSSIPEDFQLCEPYPNPFNAAAKIAYAVPTTGHVRLSVYDISGRIMGTLVDEDVTAGNHVCEFNGSGLSAGLYFVRLEAGETVLTRKAVMVK